MLASEMIFAIAVKIGNQEKKAMCCSYFFMEWMIVMQFRMKCHTLEITQFSYRMKTFVGNNQSIGCFSQIYNKCGLIIS